jgi:spore coat protein CotF
MVDGISGFQSNNVNDLQSGQLQQNQQVQNANDAVDGNNPTTSYNPLDQADISQDALDLANAQKDVTKFASLASRTPESFSSDKVSYFQSLMNSGRISSYLNGLNTQDLADNILNSPVGASFAS